MSLANSSVFNTNPVCEGLGPLEVVKDPYATIQLVVFSVLSAFIIASSIFFVWRRKNRRRLRQRSVAPIFLASLPGVVLIMIRSVYDYIGREYFSCTFMTIVFYFVIPSMTLADAQALIRYINLIDARGVVSGDTLKEATKNKTSTQHHGPASFKIWLIGYHLRRYHISEEKYRSVSSGRMASYETVTVVLTSIPYYIPLIIRVTTEPALMMSNGCTGCNLFLLDWLIIFVLLFILYAPPYANFLYKKRNIPDALHYRQDAIVASVISGGFGFIGSLLVYLDPGLIMKNQLFDWFNFEMLLIFFFHCMRCILPLYRTARIHKTAESKISLIEVLADQKAALLFEKFLIAELANENLLFWREAIRFKLTYGKSNDLEYSQQMAKVLYRTFIGKHAQLPINISDDLAHTIEAKFKGTVGRTVFDEALIEIYNLLQNGPFLRFLHSKKFKEYASTKADFSMSSIFNPLAIVPSVGEESETPQQLSVDQYIHSL